MTLDTPVAALDLSVRSANCLRLIAGLKTIGEVTECTSADLLRIPNFGRKSLFEVVELLGQLGWKLKDNPRAEPLDRRTYETAKLERNAAVFADVEAGMTRKVAAEKYGVSVTRVRQIVVRAHRRERLRKERELLANGA